MAGCFAFKASALNKLNKNFSVAVILQNENELIKYIPFGLDINAWLTLEKTIYYIFPVKRHFASIFH